LPVQSEVAQHITVLHSETPNCVDIDNGTKKWNKIHFVALE
jgi:hypothetical protein